MESELFGYEESVFTCASRWGKSGLFELAHGGTIFLDELSTMPLDLQDLYFRLNVLQLKVPPLRERQEDISLIIQAFCYKAFCPIESNNKATK